MPANRVVKCAVHSWGADCVGSRKRVSGFWQLLEFGESRHLSNKSVSPLAPCWVGEDWRVHWESLTKWKSWQAYLASPSAHWRPSLRKWKLLVAQLCPTLWDPMDCSPPGSSVHRILQARILELFVISISRRSSQPRDQTQVSCITGRFFTGWATRKEGCFKNRASDG